MHRIGAYSEGLEELGKTSQERKVGGAEPYIDHGVVISVASRAGRHQRGSRLPRRRWGGGGSS